MIIGTVTGITAVVVRNGVAYAATGATLGIVTNSGIIIGAGASAWVYWYGYLCLYDWELETKRSAYYERVRDYEACANPPARYTYTCSYCNTVYGFSEEDYGSVSDAYTAYMNFMEVHVHGW